MRTLRPLLLAALLLPACHEAGAPDPAAPLDPASAALSVRGAGDAEGPYRLEELEKLALEVRLTHAAPGAHRLRLDVVAPGGALYAQLPVSVDVGPDGAGAAFEALQVGGTPIERYHQTGAWTFRLAPESGAAPLATAQAEVAE